LEILQRYRWPGNVRELQNVIERAVLLGCNDVITEEDLPRELTMGVPMQMPRAAGTTLKEALEGPERAIILEVLESNNWNRNVTADTLGINRTTLYKKMKRLGLEEPRGKSPSQLGPGAPLVTPQVTNPPQSPTMF
jgi:DNA-binding NtrC family response regulator